VTKTPIKKWKKWNKRRRFFKTHSVKAGNFVCFVAFCVPLPKLMNLLPKNVLLQTVVEVNWILLYRNLLHNKRFSSCKRWAKCFWQNLQTKLPGLVLHSKVEYSKSISSHFHECMLISVVHSSSWFSPEKMSIFSSRMNLNFFSRMYCWLINSVKLNRCIVVWRQACSSRCIDTQYRKSLVCSGNDQRT